MSASQTGDEFAPTERLATQGGARAEGGDTLSAGHRIGDYRIDALLGRGGMGEVYRAEQLEPVRRTVALKLLRSHRLDARQLGYFEVERQVLAQMQHPAIAQIFDAGTTSDGVPYFAMEFIEGEPLTRYCEVEGLDLRARLELFLRVCEGVQHAHQKGVIHRDLKPANVLVSRIDGRAMPKIIDFGIATATSRSLAASGEIAGTPAYMSPEQAGRTPYEVDIRSDVYSLGVVLYELLTGHRPLTDTDRPGTQRTTLRPPSNAIDTLSEDEGALLSRQQGVSLPNLRQYLRRDLDWIVMHAIRQQRDERYPSAAALADDVRRFLEDRPVSAAPGGRAYVARKFMRRHRVGLFAGAMVLLALVAGLVMSLYGLWEAEAQRKLAEARSAELEQVAAFQASMLEGIDIEAMGTGLLARQRAQVEAALARQGEPGMSLAQWETLMTSTAPADLARGLLDDQILTRAIATLERDFADQPRLDADLRESVAQVHVAIGAYARAAELLAQVVERRRAELGPENVATLRAERELGLALHRSGRLPEARALQASLIERSAALADLPDDLRDEIELDYALTLSDQGQIPEAIAVQEALLARRVAGVGERDALTLRIRNNLAISMMRAGRRDEARAQFESILAIRREVLGPEHADTVASLGNLAAARGASGDVEGALALQQESYAIRRRLLGEDHPATLFDRNNLGSSLSNLGRLDEALVHLEYAVQARRRVLGASHPLTLRSMLNLGAVLSRLQRHDEALALQRDVYERRRATLGAEHPDTLNSQLNVATSLRDLGRVEEGLPLAREAFGARTRVLGAAHPDTIGSRQALAGMLYRHGDAAAAIDLMREGLDVSGLREPQRLGLAARLHAILLDAGRDEEAATLRVQALDPFLQRDPASLDAIGRQLRSEVEREMQPGQDADG